MKKCTTCKVEKLLNEFYIDKKRHDGLQATCKSCQKLTRRKWFHNNKEHTYDLIKKYRKDPETREKRRIKALEWYRNNLESCMLTRVKMRAKKLNLDFNIQKEDIIIPDVCPVLGIKLKIPTTGITEDFSPSVDRFIPKLGYVKGNIEVISVKANRIKNNASIDELEKVLLWVKKKIADKKIQ